ncbi:uncharacterized protein LOC141660555 [Apium graveolens]|uniref:uncharacterized protein LOC141660555 n=1 Tax=Apium graveolens TaxID=4045 RepID=UPI003D7BD0C5
MYASDKKGRRSHSQRMMDGFRKAVEDSSFIELNLQGGDYTWEKSKGTTRWVRERLYTCFANGSWWSKFPLCTLTVFHTSVSDHNPIKLELLNTSIPKKQLRSRFENTWLKESNFHKEVIGYWKKLPAVHLLPKLLVISSFMAKWGKEFFNKFREKIVKQKDLIDRLKDREDDDGIQMYFNEKEKLNDLLTHEEVYWQQRAKNFWLKEGDTNSKFFHAAASSRKKLNHISGLKTVDRGLITSHEGMCSLLKDYISKFFSGHETSREQQNGVDSPIITSQQNEMLIAELSFEEDTRAVKSIVGYRPNKAH